MFYSFGFMVNQGQIRRYRSIEDQARLSVYYFVVAKKIYSCGGFTVSTEGKKNPFHLFPLHYNWQLYSVSFKFPLSLLLVPFFYIFFTLIFNIYVVKLCSFELYFVLFSCPLFVFIFTSFYFKLHSFSFIFFYDPLFLWVTIRSVF